MKASMAAQMSSLIGEHGTAVTAFAYRLTGNVEEAKELTAEGYYRVAKNWGRHDHSRPLKSWCLTVMKHRFLDIRKRWKAANAISLDQPIFEGGPSLDEILPDSQEGTLASLERMETIAIVRRTLGRMRLTHRQVLALCDMQGTPYDHAAHILGIPIGTLRSRLNRAREAFRSIYPQQAYV